MTAAPPLFATNHILPLSPSRSHNWSDLVSTAPDRREIIFFWIAGLQPPANVVLTRFMEFIRNVLLFLRWSRFYLRCALTTSKSRRTGRAWWITKSRFAAGTIIGAPTTPCTRAKYITCSTSIANLQLDNVPIYDSFQFLRSKQSRALKNFYIFGNRGEKRSRDTQKRSFRSFFPLAAINSIIFWWYLQFVRQHSSEKSEKKKQRIVELSKRIRSAMMSFIRSTKGSSKHNSRKAPRKPW